jgi:hypothetical protein
VPLTVDGVAATVLAPAQFDRLDEVEKQKNTFVDEPFGLMAPLRVALGS